MQNNNFADEVRKKTEEAKLRIQKSQEDFEKQKERRLVEIDKVAAEEAKKLFEICIPTTLKAANYGESKVSFVVKKFTDPTADEKWKAERTASFLIRLIAEKGFTATSIVSKSEGDVDDPRNFYWYIVEISWAK